MKLRFVCGLSVVFSLAALAATDIPRLQKQGTATQLIVDGKPFLVLAGELRNSSGSSLEYLKPIWPQLKAMHLNTVETAIYWELLEPKEGQFDFTLVDGAIQAARENHLRVIFLWFGSWKNGVSSYPPGWVKTDTSRFPRVKTKDGASIETLSTLGAASRDADSRAFAALMRHIKQVDAERTVIMMQVENEVGVLGDSRDRGEAANKAFEAAVPKALLDYLVSHKDILHPDLRKAWEAAGSRTSGTWEQVFGKGTYTDEIFMAWNYSNYVNHVAAAGKAEYALPMYVNTWCSMTSPDHPPGTYPSGGPEPQVGNIWKVGAPAIDIRGPDLYSPNLPDWVKWYRANDTDNPLFIPETDSTRGAYHLFYALGQHDAMGFDPFAVDELLYSPAAGKWKEPVDLPLARSYAIAEELAPVILANQGKGKMAGVVVGPDDPPQKVTLGDYVLEVSYARSRRPPTTPVAATPAPPPPSPVGAMFISTGPDEYIVAGNGPVTVNFAPNTPGPPTAGIVSIEEVSFADGRWVTGRRLNGDETGQGKFLRIGGFGIPNGSIQRVKLYRYR
ncbi:MAG: DUF5597 domain-containing protein [Bryobacteraceae bacterium]|jgi:hypothetical protein